MPQRFDVAVAGAGPAGSACALRLARAGFAVALIDERDFPRPKLCGEYLNLGALRELRELGVAEALAPHAAKLQGMRLFAHDESASFVFSSSAWSMPRSELDEKIRSHAIDAGAQPIRARVHDIRNRGEFVSLFMDRDGESSAIEARFAVGADGMRSRVARLLGLSAPANGTRFATGGHYAAPVAHDWIEMYAGKDGYLAINPLSPQSANVMFVFGEEHFRRHRAALPEELTRFSRRVSKERHTFDDARLLERRRAIGPLAHATRSPVKDRVLLVGDAARFVDPFTGQGVFLALAGARLAANAIARAHTEHRHAAAFEAYARELTALFQERERVALLMRAMLLSSLISRRAARALRRRPCDFTALVDAVCGNTQLKPLELAGAVGRALR